MRAKTTTDLKSAPAAAARSCTPASPAATHGLGRLRFIAQTLRCSALIVDGALSAYPENTTFAFWRRLRFLLRSCLYLRATTPWLGLCFAAEKGWWLKSCPRNLERIHRPFLHAALRPSDILKISLQHDAFTKALAPTVTPKLATLGKANLGTISVGQEIWHMSIEILERFQKEGDWTLTIRDRSGARLVSCSFSIACLGGKVSRPRVLIGCVQGPDKGRGGHDLFRQLTQKWHGLRPKALIIYLTQTLAREIRAHNVLLVSNEAHVYSRWRYSSSKHRIEADHTALVSTLSRVRSLRGWFVLGVPATRELATSSRPTRRERRETLKWLLAYQIRTALR
ncbi:DUF535 family protein [Caballeronia sp. ATUFL_F1_KS4A]|uniref:DUF535 family protein n=1 Tax=Caballeronia sp. ATUFL_F1_KS4A TaxID=2921768 RepID=UPI0032EE3D5B